jgi:hypothetical protein
VGSEAELKKFSVWSVCPLTYLLFMEQICGRSLAGETMAKQIIERELAKFDVCFVERAERAVASRVPIDSLGWIIRVNAFVRLSVHQ